MINTLYINLEHRTDRRSHVEQQLAQFPFLHAERFNAIKMEHGALGCSKSHLKCLKIARRRGWDQVLIVEDDIQFLDPELFTKQFKQFAENNRPFDVLLISGNNARPYIHVDEVCIKVSNCQTTTGYLVQSHYYDTLIENFKRGVKRLAKYPKQNGKYAIDVYWKRLQRRDIWFLITPITVTQKEGHSDIEGKYVDYSKLIIDINKLNH